MSSKDGNNNGRRSIGEGNRRNVNRQGNGGNRPLNNGGRPVGNNGNRPVGNNGNRPMNNGRRPVGNNSYANNGKYGTPNDKQRMNGQNERYGGQQFVDGEIRRYNNRGNANQGVNNRYPGYGQGNNMNGAPGSEQYNDIVGLDENYAEDGVYEEETNLEEDAALKKKLTIAKVKKGFKIFSIVMLILVLVAGIFIYVKYGREVMSLRKEALKDMENVTEATFMKSSKSQFYAKKNGKWVPVTSSSSNIEYISMSDGGTNMALARDLMVISEDRSFYKHKGVDFWGTFKAIVWAILKGKVTRGGSTITQQLSRNVVLNDFDQNWQRKVKEMFVSWEIEKKFKDKDKIMEFYLNNINFANDYIGIENAAKGYFGKSVKDLTKGQVAFLCAIPNSPYMYNPRKHPDATNERKDRLLTLLKDNAKDNKKVQGISEDDYLTATREKIAKVNDVSEVKTTKNSNVQKIDYMLQQYLRECALDYLVRKDPSYKEVETEISSNSKYAQNVNNENYNRLRDYYETQLGSQGYCVYTSIDLDVQQQLQDSIDTKVSKFPNGKDKKTGKGEEGVYALQSSGVCIDNTTGYVVAAVNGRTGDVTNYLGRATGLKGNSYDPALARQPGSSIKPLLVYGPAFDYRDEEDRPCYDENTTVEDDGPLSVQGRKPVTNSEGNYMGSISIMDAIKGSSNVVAYKLYREVASKSSMANLINNYLGKMEFKALTTDDKKSEQCSIGGFSHGATPLEMAAAYATIAKDGEYRSPTAVIAVVKVTGDATKYDETKAGSAIAKRKRIYQKDTARTLTKCMKEVLEPRRNGLKYGGTAASSKLSIDCAGKTGTTNEKVDAWFCGFNSYYTTAIWVGRDDHKPTSVNGPKVASVWNDFNQKVISTKKLPNKELETLVIRSETTYNETTTQYYISESPSFFTSDPNDVLQSFSPMPMETYHQDPPSPTPYQPPSQAPDIPDVNPTHSETTDDDHDDDNNSNNNNNNNNNNGNHGGNSNGDMNEYPGH